MPTPSYLATSNVTHIFPCVSRPDNIKSKLMSEKNITNIIKSIADAPSYIIDYDPLTGTLKFILEGYYFEIKNFAVSGNKYASIVYKSGTNQELIDADDAESKFKGLAIYDTVPTSGSYLALCVNNSIPSSSYVKFNNGSLGITHIDCGELK